MGKMKSKFNKGVEGFFSKEGLMGDWFLQSGNIAAAEKKGPWKDAQITDLNFWQSNWDFLQLE